MGDVKFGHVVSVVEPKPTADPTVACPRIRSEGRATSRQRHLQYCPSHEHGWSAIGRPHLYSPLRLPFLGLAKPNGLLGPLRKRPGGHSPVG